MPPRPSGAVVVATDPQPTPVPLTWADDPTDADRYSVLPDDELFRFLPVGNESSSYVYDFDSNGDSHEVAADFALPVPATYSDATESYLDPTTEFAAGRIVSNEAEQLVAVTKTALGAKNGCQSSQTFTVAGVMAQASEVSHPVPDTYPTSFPSFTFDACQDQSFSNSTRGRDRWPGSPYAVAAGDLDWQVDDNGDLHDEVAIAYERANVLHVRVLDYSVAGEVISSNDHGTGLTIGYAPAAGTNTFECLDQGGAAQECNMLPGRIRAAVFNPDNTSSDRRGYIATFSTGPNAVEQAERVFVGDRTRGRRL